MSDNLRDLAERYLGGALAREEEVALASRLRADDDAARALIEAARGDLALRAALAALAQTGAAPAGGKTVRRSPPRRRLPRRALAAAAVLAAAGLLVYRGGPRPDPALPALVASRGPLRIFDGDRRLDARIGMAVAPGREIRIDDPDGFAVLAYPDGTRIEAAGIAAVSVAAGAGGGKRLAIALGRVSAAVPPQPAGQTFVFSTPQAEAAILGTRLALTVSGSATRLEVSEGTVQLTRRESGATARVAAGGVAVTGAGTDAPLLLAPEPVLPADAVADTVGVVLHLGREAAAGRFETVLLPRLRELGVRHVRDGDAVREPAFRRRVRDLGAAGIRSTIFMDPACGVSPADAVEAAKDLGPALEAVEGPCTPDIVRDTATPFAYRGLGFPEGVRAYQRDLVEAMRADPATAALPVYTPALRGPARARELGPLPADAVAMHSFPFGRLPDDALDTWWIPETRALGEPGRPLVVTSTGWHTAPGLLNPIHPQPGVSEAAAARYVPRLFLEYALRDVRRVFYYDLIDDGEDAPGRAPEAEHHFGLLRFDGTPKPAFHALRRLIARLVDPGPPVEPGTLRFALAGAPPDLKRLLLRKRDGTFCLVLWRNAASYDLAARRDLDVPPARVTLAVGSSFAAADLYLPSVSEGRVHRIPDPAVFTVEVPDHPLIVELLPAR